MIRQTVSISTSPTIEPVGRQSTCSTILSVTGSDTSTLSDTAAWHDSRIEVPAGEDAFRPQDSLELVACECSIRPYLDNHVVRVALTWRAGRIHHDSGQCIEQSSIRSRFRWFPR